MKILICGLPGSGKSWLAERLFKHIKNCAWYNNDVVRKCANDWDFSEEARIRQAKRMKTFAEFEISNGRWVICDFVAPTKKAREVFDPDFVIWLDTIKQGRFEDTNQMFEPPTKTNIHITKFLKDEEIEKLVEEIVNV
jgi:adenylylsulfate kinase